jgi:ketol-acid reductoisomerase
MRDSISNTAEYGDLTRGEVVVGDPTRKAMKKVLKQIQSGKFAAEWIKENKKGCKKFAKLREAAKHHQVEEVGEQLRKMMSWLPGEKKKATHAKPATPELVNA